MTVKNTIRMRRTVKNTSLSLFPYQIEGKNFLLKPGNKILADEMGLGKTIQAVAYMREEKIKSAIIICPAFLTEVWRIEIEKWFPSHPLMQIIDNGRNIIFGKIIIASYEFSTDPGIHSQLLKLPKVDCLIMDEAHYLKNVHALRTRHVLGTKDIKGIFSRAKKLIFLTGTPTPNNASEIYPLLKRAHPEAMAEYKFRTFAREFCYMRPSRNGERPTGFRNEEKLQELYAPVFLRRLKKDVLKDLPEKQYQIIPIAPNAKMKKLIREEIGYNAKVLQKFYEWQNSPFPDAKPPKELQALARARHEMGISKIPFIHEMAENDLAEVKKLFIVAYHKTVIYELAKRLAKYDPIVATGDDPAKGRVALAEDFQTNPKKRVFIGQLKAVGMGLTLTSASLCIFAEPWFVPGDIDQAIDRLHRIGQRDSVLAKFPLVEGSLDETILQTAFKKQEGIDRLYKIK